jgi:hypothetical protein
MKAIIALLVLAAPLFAGETIQELRAKRAAIEKTIATATAELREVNAAIAKLGKVDTLPANYIEESKDRLTAAQYEQAKSLRFGGVGVLNPGDQTWYDGVVVKLAGPQSITDIRIRFRVLARVADGWVVVEADGGMAIGKAGVVGLRNGNIGNGWRMFCPRGRLENVHAIVSMGDVPLFEALWHSEKQPVSPNGVSWWRDESLTCGHSIQRGYWPATKVPPSGKATAGNRGS